MDTYPASSEKVVTAEACDSEEALLAYALETANSVEAYKNGQINLCGLPFEWGTPDEPNTEVTVSFKAERKPGAKEGEPEHKFSIWLFIDSREVDALPDEAVQKARQDGTDPDLHNMRQITYDYNLSIDFAERVLSWHESRSYFCISENVDGTGGTITVVLDSERDSETEDAESDETAINELEMLLGGVGKELDRERVRFRVAQAHTLIEAARTRTPIPESELKFTRPEIA